MAERFFRFPVCCPVGNVGVSQSDVEFFEFTVPVPGLIHSIQFYCQAIAAAASARVKKNGDPITGDIVPGAKAVSVVTPSDPFVNTGDAITVHATTDAAGTFTALTVTVIIKQQEAVSTI